MSIRARIEDAQFLLTVGRREGAFIQVLIAAAATSKKRYGRAKWDDADAFKNFIYDELGVITNGPKYGVAFPFKGANTPLEDIFYYHLRCQLVHEGEMPETIVFTEPVREDGNTFSQVQLRDPFGFPASWIGTLAIAVWLAPENDDLWADDETRRRKAIDALGNNREVHKFCRRPGQQSKEMKARDRGKLKWEVDGSSWTLSYPKGQAIHQVANVLETKARELTK
jgi:hypothetical protein